MVASDASVEAALEPVKLFQCIRKGGRYVDTRFGVNPSG